MGFAETELSNRLITSREGGFAYTNLGQCDVLLTVLEFMPGDVRETHTHPEIRITLVRSGKMVFVSEGHPVEVASGDLVFTLPKVPHSCEVVSGDPLRIMELVVQPVTEAKRRDKKGEEECQ